MGRGVRRISARPSLIRFPVVDFSVPLGGLRGPVVLPFLVVERGLVCALPRCPRHAVTPECIPPGSLRCPRPSRAVRLSSFPNHLKVDAIVRQNFKIRLGAHLGFAQTCAPRWLAGRAYGGAAKNVCCHWVLAKTVCRSASFSPRNWDGIGKGFRGFESPQLHAG